MPQLDLSTFASQIFWLAVTFTTLYLILSVNLLPKVQNVLVSRRSRIEDDLDSADQLRDDAEQITVENDKIISEARQSATSLINSLKDKLKENAEARHKKLDESFLKQSKEVEARSLKNCEIILETLKPSVAQIIKKSVSNITGKDVDIKKIESLIDSKFQERYKNS